MQKYSKLIITAFLIYKNCAIMNYLLTHKYLMQITAIHKKQQNKFRQTMSLQQKKKNHSSLLNIYKNYVIMDYSLTQKQLMQIQQRNPNKEQIMEQIMKLSPSTELESKC